MGKRILVPVDGSEQAHEACDFTLREFPDTTLVLLHVINPAEAGYSAQASIPSFSEEWYENEKARAEGLFDEIEADAEPRGVTVERHVEVGRPTNVIVEFAEDNAIDLIVMGSHGRSGVQRLLLGSVAESVIRRASVPVTVTK